MTVSLKQEIITVLCFIKNREDGTAFEDRKKFFENFPKFKPCKIEFDDAKKMYTLTIDFNNNRDLDEEFTLSPSVIAPHGWQKRYMPQPVRTPKVLFSFVKLILVFHFKLEQSSTNSHDRNIFGRNYSTWRHIIAQS